MLTLLILVFVATIVIGVPVAFCLGMAGVAFLFISSEYSLSILPTMMFGGIDSFTLMAIPFFIMAGDMMGRAGVLPGLIDLADSIVGHFRGGLAHVTIVASMFFAGVTGVAVADCAAVGSMLIPGMVKQGYPRGFAAMVTACASIMGPIIPPSVAMLIFANVYGGGISVGKMFLMGAVPGVIIGLGMMALVYVMSFYRKFPITSDRRFSMIRVGRSFVKAIPGLMVPIIILGGIIGGFFTATEAGAVALFYAILVGLFLTRKLTLKSIGECFVESMRMSAVVFLLLGTAKIVAFILVSHQVPQKVGELFQMYTHSAFVFILFTVVFLILLGFVLEAVATMIMLIPVLAPIAVSYGVEPHMFGLIIVITVQIALITPPVALGLFITAPLARCTIEEAAKDLWPFLALMFALVMLLALFPGIATWLPALFGYK
jgi:tripartite ATP-independent transporter DctM subunit